MPTEDQILLVHAYLDGELDLASTLAVKREIDADAALAAELAAAGAVQSTLRAHFHREPVPDEFRRRVEAIRRRGRRPASLPPRWAALAASLVLAVALSSGVTRWVSRLPAGDAVATEVVDSHMRALLSGKPTDVGTSDRHIVKPWFNGRIAQAPRVIDLAKQDFPLAGARIDVIAKTPVPTLIYNRRLHVISVVAVPAASVAAGQDGSRSESGYNTIRWTEGGSTFFATSDLNAAELGSFVELFRSAPGG